MYIVLRWLDEHHKEEHVKEKHGKDEYEKPLQLYMA